MKFYYVYVIMSTVREYMYVGYSTDLRRRISEHNNGTQKSTKRYIPFELVFYEAYRNRIDAKRRELYLKSTKGKTTLRTMMKEFLNSKQK